MEIVDAARGRDIVAYTARGFDDAAALVNLPLGDSGPVYAWVGSWQNPQHQLVGVPPHTVIATASALKSSELRAEVEKTHRLPYVVEAVRDDVSVVVASRSLEALTTPLDRVADVAPLLERWLALALSQPE
jgi:hypothetical protein